VLLAGYSKSLHLLGHYPLDTRMVVTVLVMVIAF